MLTDRARCKWPPRKIETCGLENLAEKLKRIPARNEPPGFEDQYFLTHFDRLSGIVSHVKYRDTEFVMQQEKLLENGFL